MIKTTIHRGFWARLLSRLGMRLFAFALVAGGGAGAGLFAHEPAHAWGAAGCFEEAGKPERRFGYAVARYATEQEAIDALNERCNRQFGGNGRDCDTRITFEDTQGGATYNRSSLECLTNGDAANAGEVCRFQFNGLTCGTNHLYRGPDDNGRDPRRGPAFPSSDEGAALADDRCPPEMPVKDGGNCVAGAAPPPPPAPICSGNTFLNAQNECQACSDGMVPNNARDGCTHSCNTGSFTNSWRTGPGPSCTDCPRGQVPNSNESACVWATTTTSDEENACFGERLFVPFRDGIGTCRPPVKSDCPVDGQIPNPANGAPSCLTCPNGEAANGLDCVESGADCAAHISLLLAGGGRPSGGFIYGEIYDNNRCRNVTAADCSAANQIPIPRDGNANCQPCPAGQVKQADGFTCRAADNCPRGQILDGGSCRALAASDCSNGEIPNPNAGERRTGGGVEPNCLTCPSGVKHSDGLRCVATRGAHCPGGEVFDRNAPDGDNCRPPEAADCPATGEIPQLRGDGAFVCYSCNNSVAETNNGLECGIPAQADQCADGYIYDTDPNRCRLPVGEDCPNRNDVGSNETIFFVPDTAQIRGGVISCMACGPYDKEDVNGLKCIKRVAGDCRGQGRILDLDPDVLPNSSGATACRFPSPDDCVRNQRIVVRDNILTCTPCPANQVPDETRRGCESCDPGMIPNAEGSACVPELSCPPGSFPGDFVPAPGANPDAIIDPATGRVINRPTERPTPSPVRKCIECSDLPNNLENGVGKVRVNNACVRSPCVDGDTPFQFDRGEFYNYASESCQTCPAGTVADLLDPSRCVSCDEGFYAVEQEFGRQNPKKRGRRCAAIGSGQVLTSNNTLQTCGDLGAAYFPNNTKTQCIRCTGNTQQQPDGDGGTACNPCTGLTAPDSDNLNCAACADHEIPNGDNSACVSCPAGEARTGSETECRTCPANSIPSTDGAATNGCLACGNQRPNADFTECVPQCSGNQALNAQNVCADCLGSGTPNGDHSACVGGPVCPAWQMHDGSQCVNCPANQQQHDSDVTACVACPDGQGRGATDANACVAVEPVTCPAWQMHDGSQCVDCPAGRQQDSNNVNQCAACPDGQTRGATDANACVAITKADCSANGANGDYVFDTALPARCRAPLAADCGSTTDGEAPVFDASTANNVRCQVCADDGRIESPDGLACVAPAADCTGNRARNDQGQCALCPAGQQPNNDNTSCVECPDGEIRADGTADSSCEPCAAGQISNGAHTSCTDCGDGEFVDNNECIFCDEGKQANTDHSGCELCPAGEFRNDAFTGDGCQACDVGQTSNAGRTACAPITARDCRINNGAEGDYVFDVNLPARCRAPLPTDCDTSGEIIDGRFPRLDGGSPNNVGCGRCQANNNMVERNDGLGCRLIEATGLDCTLNDDGTTIRDGRIPISDAGRLDCMTCTGEQVEDTDGRRCRDVIPADCRGGRPNPQNGLPNCTVVCRGLEVPIDGTCQECPQGSSPNSDNTRCNVNCEADEVNSEDGSSCIPCTGNMVPINGACSLCPDGMQANSGNTGCDACPVHTERLANEDTACIQCNPGQIANPNSNGCIACQGNTTPHDSQNTCRTCDSGTAANDNRSACEPCTGNNVGIACAQTCTGNQAPNTDKTACETCPSGEEALSDNSACEPCSGNTAGIACSQTCSGNQAPNANKTSCEACPAGERAIPGDNSSCETCPDDTAGVACALSCTGDMISNPGKTACIQCSGEEAPNDGRTQCIRCDGNGRVPNIDNSACIAPVTSCSGNQAPNTDRNLCVDCPANTKPNADNTACVASCVGNQVPDDSTGDNTDCMTCPQGMVPNTGNYACEDEAQCDPDQYVDNNVCMDCNTGAGQVPNEALDGCTTCTGSNEPNSDGSKCIEPQSACTQFGNAGKFIYDAFDGCRSPLASDCETGGNIIDGEVAYPTTPGRFECRACTDTVFGSGNDRVERNEPGQPGHGTTCISPPPGYCPTVGRIPNPSAGLPNCTPCADGLIEVTPVDGTDSVPDNIHGNGTRCRLPEDSDCPTTPANQRVSMTDNGVLVCTNCPSHQIHVSGSPSGGDQVCRDYAKSDWSDTEFFEDLPGSNPECRPVRVSDCSDRGEVPRVVNNELDCMECPNNEIEVDDQNDYGEGMDCRAVGARDCAAPNGNFVNGRFPSTTTPVVNDAPNCVPCSAGQTEDANGLGCHTTTVADCADGTPGQPLTTQEIITSDGSGNPICRLARPEDCDQLGQTPAVFANNFTCSTCLPGTTEGRTNALTCHTTTAADCFGDNPIFDESGANPICRALLDSDCADGQIAVPANGRANCRALVKTDCNLGEVFDDDSGPGNTAECRGPIPEDCGVRGEIPNPPLIQNGTIACHTCPDNSEIEDTTPSLTCRPVQAGDCPNGQIAAPNDGMPNCRLLVATDCGDNEVFDNSTPAVPQCRAAVLGDCGANDDGMIPDPDGTPLKGDSNCTPCTDTDVGGAGYIEDTDGISCRIFINTDCGNNANGQIPTSENGRLVCMTCPAGSNAAGGMVENAANGTSCRELRANECGGRDGEIPVSVNGVTDCQTCEASLGGVVEDGDGLTCRRAMPDDCVDLGEIPEPSGGLPNCTDCPSHQLEKSNALQCEDKTKADCQNTSEYVFDENHANRCRLPLASDCPPSGDPINGQIPRQDGREANNVMCENCIGGDLEEHEGAQRGLVCRAPKATDCQTDGEIIDGEFPGINNGVLRCEECRSHELEQEQVGNPNRRGLQCRDKTQADCTVDNPVFDRNHPNRCRPRARTDCDPGTIFESGTGGGTCRAQRADDCDALGMIPNAMDGEANCTPCTGSQIERDDTSEAYGNGTGCRDLRGSDCPAQNIIPSASGGVRSCDTACEAHQIEHTDSELTCRNMVTGDCAALEVFDNTPGAGTDWCRERRASDCQSNGNDLDGEYPNPTGGDRNCTPCAVDEVEQDSGAMRGLECRDKRTDDCADEQVFDEGVASNCRPLRASDCGTRGEIPDADTTRGGVAGCDFCPTSQVEDTTPSMTCRNIAASDCPDFGEVPMPQNGLPNCRPCSDLGSNMIEVNAAGNHDMDNQGTSCRNADQARDCTSPEVPSPSNGLANCSTCPVDEPFFDSGSRQCRERKATDCPVRTIFESGTGGGTCRPQEASDCPDRGWIPNAMAGDKNCTQCASGEIEVAANDTYGEEGTSCRPVRGADCPDRGEFPTANGGMRVCTPCAAHQTENSNNETECRDTVTGDCPNGTVFDSTPGAGNSWCRQPRANDCPTIGEVPGNPTNGDADCTACTDMPLANNQALQIEVDGSDVPSDTAMNNNGTQCRVADPDDCPAFDIVPVSNSGRLVCTACAPERTERNQNRRACIPKEAMDCPAETVFDTNETDRCRDPRASDCPDEGEIPIPARTTNGVPFCDVCPDSSQIEGTTPALMCRDTVPSDCMDPQVPNPENGLPNCGNCPTNRPVFEGGSCRLREARDCANGTIFVAGTSACRPQAATDCPTPGMIPFAANGVANCGTCSAGEIEVDGSDNYGEGTECRAISGDDCPDRGEFPTANNGMRVCTPCAAHQTEDTATETSCRNTEATDCADGTIFDSTPGANNNWCRQPITADCPVLGEVPRNPTNGDPDCFPCTAIDHIEEVGNNNSPHGNGTQCRHVLPGDCPTIGNVPNAINGLPGCAPCSGSQVEGDTNALMCRNREADDCPTGEIFVPSNRTCRDPIPTDCPTLGQIPMPVNGLKSCGVCPVGQVETVANTPLAMHGEGTHCRDVDATRDCTDPLMPTPNARNGLPNCTDCPAHQEFDPVEAQCRDRVANDCGTMIFVSSTSGGGGTCRDETGNDCPTRGLIPDPQNGVANCQRCSGLLIEAETPSLTCRAATKDDCPGQQVPNPGNGLPNCRDCRADEVYDAGNRECRLKTAADCPAGEIFVDANQEADRCRPVRANDCATNGNIRDGEIPGSVEGVLRCTECTGTEVELSNGSSCGAVVANDCPTVGEIPTAQNGLPDCNACTGEMIERDNQNRHGNGTQCRDVSATDCPTLGQIAYPANGAANCAACRGTNEIEVDGNDNHNQGTECRAREAADCPVFGEIPNAANGTPNCAPCSGNTIEQDGSGNHDANSQGTTCRAATPADCPVEGENPAPVNGLKNCVSCPSDEIFDNGSCRAKVITDCALGEVFDQADPNRCRAPRASDCPANGQIPNPQNGDRNCTACEPHEVERTTGANAGLACRPKVATDCPAGEVFDPNNPNRCRAPLASDCAADDEYPHPVNGLPTCMACQGVEIPKPDDSGCVAPITCTGNQVPDPDAGFLECAPCTGDTAPNANNTQCIVCADVGDGFNANRNNTACDFCAAGRAVYEDTNIQRRICVPPVLIEGYTENECEQAGWNTAAEIDGSSNVRVHCLIPVRIDSRISLPDPTPAPSGLPRAQQTAPADGARFDGCILGENAGFTGGVIPSAPCEMIFAPAELPEAEGGGRRHFPRRPQSIAAPQPPKPGDTPPADDQRLIVNPGTADTPPAVFERTPDGSVRAVERFVPSSGGDKDAGVYVAGLALAGLLLAYSYWDGNPDRFSMTPHTSFSHNNGSLYYSYGSRLDFRQDNLGVYWGASRTRASDEESEAWRYSTGISYAKDFWRAELDALSYATGSDFRAGLSAERKFGAWRWESGITAEFRATDTGDEKSVYWSSETAWPVRGWEINPSFNLFWEDGQFGDNGIFRVRVKREF